MEKEKKIPSEETVVILANIVTEITANKVLRPETPEELAHNGAIDMCVKFLYRYSRGDGLFQL